MRDQISVLNDTEPSCLVCFSKAALADLQILPFKTGRITLCLGCMCRVRSVVNDWVQAHGVDHNANGGPPTPGQCPKCEHQSGDDWRQCGGKCPMTGSPHYDPVVAAAHGVHPAFQKQSESAVVGESRKLYGVVPRPARVEVGVCDCDLRNRRWNPNTQQCETCHRFYRSPV